MMGRKRIWMPGGLLVMALMLVLVSGRLHYPGTGPLYPATPASPQSGDLGRRALLARPATCHADCGPRAQGLGLQARRPGSLAALLRLAPDQLDDDESGLPVKATYADLERWMAAQDVEGDRKPQAQGSGATDAAFAALLEPLELPEVLQSRGLGEEWQHVYGFNLHQVDQILAVGHPPDQIVIMPGHYDVDELYETWVRNGYQAVEVEETTVWSLAPGDRIDLSAPASRPALGLLNNVVLLDDGTLIASARQSRMAEVLRVVNGTDASLYDNDRLRAAVVAQAESMPVSAVITDGNLLQLASAHREDTVSASPVASTAASPPPATLPRVDLVLFGLAMPAWPGTPPVLTMTMIYEKPPPAIGRLPALITSRAAVSDAWSRRYWLRGVDIVGKNAGMIEVRLSPRESGGNAFALIADRDLAPFAWSADG